MQTVSLSNFNSLDETYTPAKQKVVVSNIGGNEQITFRLGLYGVFTGQINVSSNYMITLSRKKNRCSYT